MKVAIDLPGAGVDTRDRAEFEDSIAFVLEAEKLGVDSVWVAEAWGMDCVVPMAILAARTARLRIGSHIMQISARRPSMAAMTALTLALASGNRFLLGLGVSGPQVVEGLHGVPFAHPYDRLREYVQILRLAFSGDKIVHEGRQYRLPLPGGEGKALRIALPPNPGIPILLAALGPKSLEMTGELADGWLGTAFIPEAADIYLDRLRAGAARVQRLLDGFEVRIPVPAGIGSDVSKLMASRKASLAFQMGGMGSPKTNFYNQAFRRVGFEDTAAEVQRLWNSGRRDEAVKRVPDEMVLKTSLIGTEAEVRERLRRYRAAGVTMLGVQPFGRNRDEKLGLIERMVKLCAELEAEGPAGSVAA
ncbi:MAG TPA: LLM class F420-dependent oxidoreductase [Burkholderiales bacterium]|nr:LLM class F420-dependent oxidoreductase [Burkholderiales bacterium]